MVTKEGGDSLLVTVDAEDGNEGLIHQTISAKKPQRLDELPDYMRFSFLITPFTDAFLEEVT